MSFWATNDFSDGWNQLSRNGRCMNLQVPDSGSTWEGPHWVWEIYHGFVIPKSFQNNKKKQNNADKIVDFYNHWSKSAQKLLWTRILKPIEFVIKVIVLLFLSIFFFAWYCWWLNAEPKSCEVGILPPNHIVTWFIISSFGGYRLIHMNMCYHFPLLLGEH